MQELEMKTVALGMRIEKNVRDLLIFTFPFIESVESVTTSSTANKSILAVKSGNAV
jgi:hypothetical protein